ncbi:hypothetical protein MBLNU230_g3140t1 [Neophaeotheca triangularis]
MATRIRRVYSDPYVRIAPLGGGSYGQVDLVRDPSTDIKYARKTLNVAMDSDAATEAPKALANEISAMQRLRHHHIPVVLDAYILQAPGAISVDYAFVMEQVAQKDLQYALYRENAKGSAVLKRAFGCLAATVAHLHHSTQFVRHKDIHPGNILLYDDRVLLTDFGLAHDAFTLGMKSMSTNANQHGSPRYWPPENENPRAKHSAKGDIFALGCVFLEILVKLYGFAFDLRPQNVPKFHQCTAMLRSFLQTQQAAATGSDSTLSVLLDLCSDMISSDHKRRPTAAEVESRIRAVPERAGLFCKACLQRRRSSRTVELPSDNEDCDSSEGYENVGLSRASTLRGPQTSATARRAPQIDQWPPLQTALPLLGRDPRHSTRRPIADAPLPQQSQQRTNARRDLSSSIQATSQPGPTVQAAHSTQSLTRMLVTWEALRCDPRYQPLAARYTSKPDSFETDRQGLYWYLDHARGRTSLPRGIAGRQPYRQQAEDGSDDDESENESESDH